MAQIVSRIFDIFYATLYQTFMTDMAGAPPKLREQKKDEVRMRIVEAATALLANGGEDLSHDAVAARAGVGRRTVYRYFPDHEALMQGIWVQVRALIAPKVALPRTGAELLSTLEATYTGLDRISALATVVRSTPQGRAMRLAGNGKRVAAYTAAAAEAVGGLPKDDQKLATAMLQVLHTTLWLEMRDHWGLDGAQIARTAGWAMRTLLADLKRRGNLPLDEDPS